MNPLVSVILPVYNVKPYLEQCIKSILEQTLEDIEIICIDDGSTDGSAEILKKYSLIDSRISVNTQKNLGAGNARNKGLALAKGKYLSILDADDFFEPTMLEKAYKCAQETKSDIVIYRANWYHNEAKIYEDRSHVISPNILPSKGIFGIWDISSNPFYAVTGWTWDKLFRNEFIKIHGIRFQEQKIFNDMYFAFISLFLAERISCVFEVLAHQRIQREGAISKSVSSNWICICSALHEVKSRLKKEGLYEWVEQYFVNYALHMMLFTLDRTSGIDYVDMYKELRDRQFKSLDISMHSQDYFYNEIEFFRYQEIAKIPIEVMLLDKLREREVELNALKKNSANLKYIQTLKRELLDMQMSKSYRIGRVITFIPRKIRGGICCYREHGLTYTVQRIKDKLKI